jgi:hypothetical protein
MTVKGALIAALAAGYIATAAPAANAAVGDEKEAPKGEKAGCKGKEGCKGKDAKSKKKGKKAEGEKAEGEKAAEPAPAK